MKLIKFIVYLFSFLWINISLAKNVENIQYWHTSNGAQVFFIQAKQIPMLDIAVVFKAGAVYDGEFKGLASLTNMMLNEGTGNYNVEQLAERFDNVGAQFSNEVSKEWSIIGLRTLTDQRMLQPALQTFSLILTEPSFPQKSLDRIKKQMIVGLKYSQQQPSYIASQIFSKAIWGTHPYANPVDGNLKSIPNLSRQQVEKFYHDYYVAKNAMLAMVGDISLARAHKIAKQVLEKLPTGKAAAAIPMVRNNLPKEQHIPFDSVQNAILIGEVGVKHNNADRFPLLVGNYILGGGLNSILMRNIREKYGLTYGISSQFSSLSQRGVFVIALNSRNNKEKRAIKLTKQYLKNYLQQGPTKKELQTAKKFLIGSFPLGISNNSALLQNLIYIGYYHLPLNFLDTYCDKITKVTSSKIKMAFQQHVKMNRLVTISVGGS